MDCGGRQGGSPRPPVGKSNSFSGYFPSGLPSNSLSGYFPNFTRHWARGHANYSTCRSGWPISCRAVSWRVSNMSWELTSVKYELGVGECQIWFDECQIWAGSWRVFWIFAHFNIFWRNYHDFCTCRYILVIFILFSHVSKYPDAICMLFTHFNISGSYLHEFYTFAYVSYISGYS